MIVTRSKLEVNQQLKNLLKSFEEGDLSIDPVKQGVIDRLHLAAGKEDLFDNDNATSDYYQGVEQAEQWLYGQSYELEIL